jgi:PmbA protein
MIELCQYAVSVGDRQGADEVEAIWVKEISTTVEAELGEISKASMIKNEAMRIRVTKEKALGSLYTYRMGKDDIEKAVERALAAARASKQDVKWDSLPSPRTYSRVDVWDKTVENLGSEDLTAPIIEMLQLLPGDILPYLVGSEIILQEKACANSNGIAHADRGTMSFTGLVGVGKLEEGVTPAFNEVVFSRKYDIDPQKIAEALTEKINLFKKMDTASSGKSLIVFSPSALEVLLRFTLFKALSGENVMREKSLLAGKQGETVASPTFTLHDNGITQKGFAAAEMDDEGVPCQDTPLIENGVLQGFIWNDYWAKRSGGQSTGNAHYNTRNDEMVIQQSAMIMSPGDYSYEELMDVEDGYYVLDVQGAHSSNPESGDFFVTCSPGYRIRNGEIAGGVTGMMISDNVFSLIQNVDAVGSSPQVLEHSILPLIRFAGVNVASK